MTYYRIEKNVKRDSTGTEISTTWDIFDLNGKLLKNGIKSESIAQSWVKNSEEKDFLFEETKKIKPQNTHPKNK